MFCTCAVIVLILVSFALYYAPSRVHLCLRFTFNCFQHAYVCSLPSTRSFAHLRALVYLFLVIWCVTLILLMAFIYLLLYVLPSGRLSFRVREFITHLLLVLQTVCVCAGIICLSNRYNPARNICFVWHVRNICCEKHMLCFPIESLQRCEKHMPTESLQRCEKHMLCPLKICSFWHALICTFLF
jgi:hypothetical protein